MILGISGDGWVMKITNDQNEGIHTGIKWFGWGPVLRCSGGGFKAGEKQESEIGKT
jgi:hypothetical protein